MGQEVTTASVSECLGCVDMKTLVFAVKGVMLAIGCDLFSEQLHRDALMIEVRAFVMCLNVLSSAQRPQLMWQIDTQRDRSGAR